MQSKKDTPVNFSEHLAALLREHGLTQKDFAAAISVSPATVVKWMKGTVPMADALQRAADYFSMHPAHLLHPDRMTGALRDAAAAAKAHKGTPEEKQRIFQEHARRNTQLASAESRGAEAALSAMSEAQASYESVWKHRALSAEKKLKELKASLAELINKE